MFDCGGKGQFSAGKTEFIRLGDLDSRMSTPDKSGINRRAFNIEGPTHISKTEFRSSKGHMIRGSERFKFLGHSFNFGTSKEVFPEDLKESERKIFNPQDKFLQLWNRLFVFCCLVAVYVDPLFFYLPVTLSKKEDATCLSIDRKLAITSTTLRTVIDVVYILRIFFQFRIAYVAPSSRVFGRGELVIDPTKIAKRYLSRYAMMDFLAILPLPQVIIWRYLHTSNGSDVLTTKEALRFIVIFQYIPRFFRIFPLTSEVKRTTGALFQTAWAGALYYLLWFMLISHIVGAVWYLSSVDSQEACWRELCTAANISYSNIYCSNNYSTTEHNTWKNLSLGNLTLENKTQGISINCSAGSDSLFKFGIFEDAITNEIISFREFLPKYFYCLWWGLRNLSTLGQGLETSTEPREVMFSIAVAILGLILFALLIGNMQTYLQSLTTRLEEMRVKRRDSEHWMHHRLLPQELRKRVRRYDQYKWLETRGVDEETLLQSLPKDLRRDIKRHLCLDLVRKVHLFQKMDETLLDAICERLKPILCIENTYIVRESDPVDEMLFIIRGRLESVTTDGGRSGFYNRSLLKEGDFCGEELLTWALDPKSGSNLPSSTRTVNALTEVEAFALTAEDLKFVASQFRRLHSRQVQHTFRYFSQQWKTWAARFIQAAWRRYTKRKALEERRGEDEALGADDAVHGGSASLGAAIYVSRFATNALRGVKRSRNTKTTRELITLQKPPEPDFSVHE